MASLPNERIQFYRRIIEAASQFVRKYTTPIICHNRTHENQHGMGFFLQIAESKFLVTAAHVINQATDAGYDLSLFDAFEYNTPCRAVPLSGQPIQIPDVVDVAVLEVSVETLSRLPNRQFVPLSYLLVKSVRPGQFSLMGYPINQTEGLPDGQSRYLHPFAYGTDLYVGDVTQLENYDPKVHILFHREIHEILDLEGNVWRMPTNLGGISGCPVLQLHQRGARTDNWSAQKIDVVGIQTGVYSKAIKASRCWAICKILWDTYPRLRGALALNGCTPDAISTYWDSF
jgi:hypothetical protein